MSRHSWTDISSQARGRQSVCIAARSACWQQKRVSVVTQFESAALGLRVSHYARRYYMVGETGTTLASVLAKADAGLRLNEHLEHDDGEMVFRHACKLGLEGIVSKRLGSPYRSGRSRHWVKSKNPAAPAVKREAEEDWTR
jgi:ATP-dependent DNA ligase